MLVNCSTSGMTVLCVSNRLLEISCSIYESVTLFVHNSLYLCFLQCMLCASFSVQILIKHHCTLITITGTAGCNHSVPQN
jgi:hypothetical protein